ncbi:solute carrier family 49 member 4 homolog isoform X1 [Sycon ciliatum]|uniref:solute carrier family 49 member 4 homolog isoform X1 n=1 Tax=Sycon ciliatum TaxID=27933 RepID=UPI0031F610D7
MTSRKRAGSDERRTSSGVDRAPASSTGNVATSFVVGNDTVLSSSGYGSVAGCAVGEGDVSLASEEPAQASDRSTAALLPGKLVEEGRETANVTYAVYKYRWWVLFVVWLVIFEEACLWNTWGPIADVAKQAFGWTDGTIALLANWGCIGFTIAAGPLSWAMGRRTLKAVFLFSALCGMACTALRCITMEPNAASYLINFAHLLNGLSAPVALGAGPVISAKWFPPSERVTATAVAGMSTTVGVATSFLLGPLLVPDTQCNGTSADGAVNHTFESNFTILYDECIDGLRHNIRNLMLVHLGFSAVVLFLVVFTLKTEPKSAPSHSSAIPRLEFRPGLRKLIRNTPYIVISVVYGLINGLFSGWGAVLSLILGMYGVSQRESGFIGFYSTIAGGFTGILMARIADKYSRRHKELILVVLVGSIFAFLALSVVGHFSSGETHKWELAVYYIAVILGGIFQYGLIPIMLELAVEISYPVAEGITAVFMTFFSCFFVVIFLGLLYIPGIGVVWLNWSLVAVLVFGTTVIVFVKPQYSRLDQDLSQ